LVAGLCGRHKFKKIKLEQKKQNKKDMTTNYKQLTGSDVNWPMVNGEEITTQTLKAKQFSVVTNSFRDVAVPYKINGHSIMLPVPIPTFEIRRKNLQGAIIAKGGYVTIKVMNSKVCVVGESKCRSDEHFDKTVGIKLATADAVAQLVKLGAL
jgi:hypothetical protein